MLFQKLFYNFRAVIKFLMNVRDMNWYANVLYRILCDFHGNNFFVHRAEQIFLSNSSILCVMRCENTCLHGSFMALKKMHWQLSAETDKRPSDDCNTLLSAVSASSLIFLATSNCSLRNEKA